jgi:hypothetical protein
MRRVVHTEISRHYAAHIALLKGLAEDLSVLRNLRLRSKSGWGASGIDGPHMDGTRKRINLFMEG